jgi:hypothetical protein
MTTFNSNSTVTMTAEAAVTVRVAQAAAAEGCVGAEDTMASGGLED